MKTFAVKSKLELYSSEWLRSKNQPITNEDNCFQNAIKESKKTLKKQVKKIVKPYINQYNWEGIEFPAGPKDWKNFEQNNKEIALNILFASHNKKETRPAYISKYNYQCKIQVILLIITDDGERWHYLVVRGLSALLKGISPGNNGDFYCLNYFHPYCTLNRLKKHERLCNNHDYGHVDIPEEGKNIFKYSSGEKSLKVPFIIYADLEYLLKKEQSCQNNPQNSYTQRKAKHKPSG